jgi:L-amino acid N-acyltransferase YncA
MLQDLTTRPATPADAASIAAIYNEGIDDRVATFETEPRTPAQIEAWFGNDDAIVVAVEMAGEVVGYAGAFPYSDRCCYAGVAEFTVYVRRDQRGRRVGEAAMWALLQAAQDRGQWKLLSRIFVENVSSRALMAKVGFKEIGVHEKHGKLDGVWRDCVIVERLIPENLT